MIAIFYLVLQILKLYSYVVIANVLISFTKIKTLVICG
jgi:YggT family protein